MMIVTINIYLYNLEITQTKKLKETKNNRSISIIHLLKKNQAEEFLT